jgi:hypothetical protein
MVFIKGINAPLIQVTNPKIKNRPAIINIGIKVFLIVFVSELDAIFDCEFG